MNKTSRRILIEMISGGLVTAIAMLLWGGFDAWIARADDITPLRVDFFHITFYRVTQAIGQFHGQIFPVNAGILLVIGAVLVVGLVELWRKLSHAN
ncbi:LlsX family protein [Levilactobacillus lanxiensis]|uniref:LlsX family protein n=1 Tax=Levilactobacillus lanxiensis TaxID=2799568 RepID=A0ABW4D370_9LACO|nr:LlsX family protein [Levilactobacillus lanxiensis]